MLLRPTLDRPLHRDGDPYDDGPLPDLMAGLMWFATGLNGLLVQLLPGTAHGALPARLRQPAGLRRPRRRSRLPARVFGFSVAVIGQTIAMQILKRRLVRAELRQRSYAEMDPLTAIGNRRGFDHALARAEESEERYALVLFDLDDFKSINDFHGHPTGDIVLRTVAHAAQNAVRRGDCLARIGGDEFAVIAPGAEDGGAERLVRALADEIDAAAMPEGVHEVGVTFAWAVAPIDAEDGEGLLSRADQRLLAHKRAGKQAQPVA